MKTILEYLSTKIKPFIIKANDNNIKQIVNNEIDRFGNEADLNHINVSDVTNMHNMFDNSIFNGDISYWDVSNVTNMYYMFHNCPLEKNPPKWYKK